MRFSALKLPYVIGALSALVLLELVLLLTPPKEEFILSPERIIIRTEEGFSPERLVVRQGDRVTFRNNSAHPSWPASDLHPSHGIYPAFDPHEPLAPGAEWTFVFEMPGRWAFHDHLAANKVGEVIVLDNSDAAPVFECGDVSQSECFKQDVIQVLEAVGLEPALDRMAELFEAHSAFRGSCHDVAHTLGYAAYDLYARGEAVTLTGKTSYCSYGFYHGFMETMLLQTGNVAEAREFCEEAGRQLDGETTNAKFACYHGIGHGVVDGGDPRDWGDPVALIEPGITMCDQVNPEEPYFYRCASGAFNSLAIMYFQEDYGLSFLPEDNPYDICARWDEFRIQRPCYGEMNIPAWNIAEKNLHHAIRLVERIAESDHAAFAMASVSGVASSSFGTEDFLAAIAACRSARADLVLPCIRGIPSGIMEVGTPGREYELALEFCMVGALSEEERGACLGYLFGGIRAYYPQEKRSTICATVEERYRERCLTPHADT